MDHFEKYYTLSLVYLTRRARSVKEIRDYLLKKKASEEIIEAVIKKLHEQRFQSDIEFARWWVEQRTRIKAKSNYLIRMELRQKGISDEIISTVLTEETEESKTDLQKAKSVIEKYRKRVEGLPRIERNHKLAGYLGRRGFDFETIRAAIDACFERRYNSD